MQATNYVCERSYRCAILAIDKVLVRLVGPADMCSDYGVATLYRDKKQPARQGRLIGRGGRGGGEEGKKASSSVIS